MHVFNLAVVASLFTGSLALDAYHKPHHKPHHKPSEKPSVTVLNTKFVGNLSDGVESFYGIPYAQPPIGPLRLRRPQPIIDGYASRTMQATATPTACAQLDNFFPPTFGFDTGATQQYEGAVLIKKSIDMEHPILFVAVNYRVGAFGFLAGKEVQAEGVSNLGFYDQRLGLQWVQDNIAAFGGDPEKVTISGESAGGVSAFSHTLINGGDNLYDGRPLFRGAILGSNSLVPADEVNGTQAQAIYDMVIREVGCTSSSNTLHCLRNVPFEQLRAAANTIPNIFTYSSLAIPFLPRPDPTDSFFPVSPELALRAGNYTRIPIISGNEEDEATRFSTVQTNLTTTAQLVDYMQIIFKHSSQSLRQGLVDGYSNNTAAGSPFGTGAKFSLYPQYKRLAAILGDSIFTLRRREHLSIVADTGSVWSYLDTHRQGQSSLGTYHTSDIEVLFDTKPFVNGSFGPLPADTFLSFFVSFTNYLDPNAIDSSKQLIQWPRYTKQDPVLLNISASSNTLIQDDFRASNAKYLSDHSSEFRL
ncbi:hypothetical protein BP5796_04276 [Coleophoma crateriformis]|uniref:Carboxylic ester hydrolase n=1 Tax=Coleophoma crateriformis TaxID=565419 RepID=A0A3D8SIE5_9HELO|nr:hypothetical protein BP5796_04276 [Coleophoma crateriformis]